ncbi:hypothetical protein [Nostoc sp. FACHB-280]|uniref:hypothetical protein n=1 Tax=Nostoc sp. FACHB-280 TaxID=2692839 RepID=UPI00168BC9CD|nr:hypothetical protein [Nostoc sp. FACHB-280]MBD2498350.1 hypothetical protein [Nostoc sp. FACHB-280]
MLRTGKPKLESQAYKPELNSFLSSGPAVPTRIAIMAVVGCSVACISLMVQFLNYGAIRRLAKQEVPSLVQLSNGETITATAVEPAYRSNETIKRFVSDTFVGMFNWDGLIQKNNAQGKLIVEADPGVEVKGLENQSTLKVTTRAYEAAFALSEKQGFRAAFVRRLAQMIPSEVFSGNMRVAIIPNYISSARKIKEGKWEVDFQSTLVTFKKLDNAGDAIAFNKTVTLEAVTTPQKPPEDISELAKKIYAIRSSGLEITQIVDLDLGKR